MIISIVGTSRVGTPRAAVVAGVGRDARASPASDVTVAAPIRAGPGVGVAAVEPVEPAAKG